MRVRDAEILKKEAASEGYQNRVLENNEKIFQAVSYTHLDVYKRQESVTYASIQKTRQIGLLEKEIVVHTYTEIGLSLIHILCNRICHSTYRRHLHSLPVCHHEQW